MRKLDGSDMESYMSIYGYFCVLTTREPHLKVPPSSISRQKHFLNQMKSTKKFTMYITMVVLMYNHKAEAFEKPIFWKERRFAYSTA